MKNTKIIIPAALLLISGTAIAKAETEFQNSVVKTNLHISIQKNDSISKEEIKITVYKIVSEKLGVSISEINNDKNYINDLGADSLDFVEIVMEYEKVFEIRIPDEYLDKMSTVGKSIDVIFDILNEK